MKTKNQTERDVLELGKTSAANEDFSASPHDASDSARHQAWSPYEVWRTRVKHPAHPSPENPQIRR